MRVVIAGAGFAGMNVAKELEGDVEVTLVAPTERFVYVPLIHEVASDSVRPTEVYRDLKDVLPRATLVHGRALRREGRTLVTAAGERLAFDKLVVAVGSEPNDFGVKGVREHALTFHNLGDALRANGTIKTVASQLHGRPIRIVIVGASFTGVEVAGELATLCDDLGLAREIVLLDALPQIFPRQSDEFRKRVEESLAGLKLELRTKQTITEVRPDAVMVGSERVESDVAFWCAGVKPRAIEGVDPNVTRTLQSASDPDVFVAGDAARFPKGMGVPQLAQTAEDQAKVVAWNVLYPEKMRAYEPDVRGLIVSIGRNRAVAELKGGMVISGNVPWHVKRMLYKARIALT